MSTTVPVNIAEWSPSLDDLTTHRPAFINPVPAQVHAGGLDVGELDAYLAWEGDFLLARIDLPALPGHVLRASCRLQADTDSYGNRVQLTIRIIDVTIEHLNDHAAREAGRTTRAEQGPVRRDVLSTADRVQANRNRA